MRLAIVHYHLRKGGVTRVISSAVEALGGSVEAIVVLSSTPPEEAIGCPCVVVPELAYCATASAGAVDQLHRSLRKAATESLGGEPDLWHIHNHCLGKNVNFPEVLKRLLADGARALLQIHDFAEDGRPSNYAAQQQPYLEGMFNDPEGALYPVAPQVGYAVLNGRDRRILESAGIPSGQVHWLPNAVQAAPIEQAEGRSTGDKPLILYPTRAIRRKNIGELLLLAMANPEYRFATTLTPKNPEWLGIHSAWDSLARRLSLDVHLGLGEVDGNTFDGLVGSSTAMVTTSVAEGFGLAFLEPWLFRKSLRGRNLPEITADFTANGIALPGLYDTLPISTRLLDQDGLRKRYSAELESVFAAYDEKLAKAQLESAWEAFAGTGEVDFGRLDEAAQAEVLENLGTGAGLDGLPPASRLDLSEEDPIEANVEQIEHAYGLAPYGEALSAIYNNLLDAEPVPVQALPHGAVLSGFLDTERFNLLRT
jgi:glycosyltransferase involved in cell wall biosynthesis